MKEAAESQTEAIRLKLMTEVQLKLNLVFETAKKLNQDLPQLRVFKVDSLLQNMIKGYQALREGRSFESQRCLLKLNLLLKSEQAQ